MRIVQSFKYRIWHWGLIVVILAIASFTLGLPSLAYAQSTQATVSAKEAFRTAYENRYTWDTDFPGFSAEVSVNVEGELDQGIVRIKPDFSVDVINIERDDLRELIANQLQMEVVHRRRVPFAKRHEASRFELEGTDESGALKIKEVDNGKESSYKVKDNIITQVNRSFNDTDVTVDTLGTTNTPLGYVVAHFQTTFRDAKTGEILEKQDVRDFHEKISKYYFLTYRTIRSTTEGNPEDKLVADALIRLNDIQPL